MANILKIVQAGHPVLRRMARPLTPEQLRGPEIQRLIEEMRETMYDAPGVGLAAPQVGLGLQLLVLEDKPAYIERGDPEAAREKGRTPVPFQVLANPRLTVVDRTLVEFFEGCLSVADMMMVVPRVKGVKVEALDHRGEKVTLSAEGWPARILQHEIDHLRGVLCIDRMKSRTFTSGRNHGQYAGGMSVAEVLAEAGTTDEVDAALAAHE
ncbi:MAG TPA: peptide deformylase [Polyangia bacterium]|jgi:peptide deformylase